MDSRTFPAKEPAEYTLASHDIHHMAKSYQTEASLVTANITVSCDERAVETVENTPQTAPRK